jgi:hypothetical protein
VLIEVGAVLEGDAPGVPLRVAKGEPVSPPRPRRLRVEIADVIESADLTMGSVDRLLVLAVDCQCEPAERIRCFPIPPFQDRVGEETQDDAVGALKHDVLGDAGRRFRPTKLTIERGHPTDVPRGERHRVDAHGQSHKRPSVRRAGGHSRTLAHHTVVGALVAASSGQQSPKEWKWPLFRSTRDDAITGCEVLDLMERAPKLEHPRRRVEVGPIRVRLRENRSALSDVMARRMIDRVDERVRPVAPVDAAWAGARYVNVEALGGLDALKAALEHVSSVSLFEATQVTFPHTGPGDGLAVRPYAPREEAAAASTTGESTAVVAAKTIQYRLNHQAEATTSRTSTPSSVTSSRASAAIALIRSPAARAFSSESKMIIESPFVSPPPVIHVQ